MHIVTAADEGEEGNLRVAWRYWRKKILPEVEYFHSSLRSYTLYSLIKSGFKDHRDDLLDFCDYFLPLTIFLVELSLES